MFIQPIALSYFFLRYKNTKFSYVLLIMYLAIASYASLTSGSRLIGILFSLPMLFFCSGKKKYFLFFVTLYMMITIGTLSRTFYLPNELGSEEVIQIYSNEQYQYDVLQEIEIWPLIYLISRMGGMGQLLLMNKNFSNELDFLGMIQTSLAYFLPFMERNAISIKEIYGFSEDTFGGFALDMFSNYYLAFGGSYILYFIGILFIGFMMGKIHRYSSIVAYRMGFECSDLIFLFLWILFFDRRGEIFPLVLFLFYLASNNHAYQKFISYRLSKKQMRNILI
jgi:hypothetical protein